MKKIVLLSMLLLSGLLASSQIVPVGLVSKWYFNNGDATDDANGHDGTVTEATPVTDRFGNANHAFDFDGFNDMITVPFHNDFNVSTGLTISAWVYRDVFGASNEAIVARWNSQLSSEQYILMLKSPGILNADFTGAVGNSVTPAFGYTYNWGLAGSTIWYHLVFTWDTSNVHKIYLDGNVHSAARPGFETINDTTMQALYIGAQGGNARFFEGRIDDVRLYNRAISQSEVDSLFNEQNPVTSLNPSSPQNSYAIYPNPAQNELIIESEAGAHAVYEIVSATGAIVQRGDLNELKNRIDVSALAPGLYCIRLSEGRRQYQQKFIKR